MVTTTRAILLAILLTGSTVWVLADWSRLFAVAGAGSVTGSDPPQLTPLTQPQAQPQLPRGGFREYVETNAGGHVINLQDGRPGPTWFANGDWDQNGTPDWAE